MSGDDEGSTSGARSAKAAPTTVRGGAYYPAPDELDPNVEINLNSLRDAPADGKPLYSYATLIRYAIKGSPDGRLLLEEIYYAIEQRYPYFKTAPAGWKNSVRHNLSLNSCFRKVPRPLTDRGKGSYWMVDDSVDPKQGIHRVRSRRRKNKNGGSETGANAAAYHYGYGAADGSYDSYAAMYPSYGYDNAMFPPSYDVTGAPMAFSDPSLGASPDQQQGHGHGNQNQNQSQQAQENNVEWRSLYLAELERLRSMTKEQDKDGAPHEWYRMMTMRLRMGMLGLPPFTPGPAGGGGLGPSDHRTHQNHGRNGSRHARDEDADGADDSGLMEDEEDE